MSKITTEQHYQIILSNGSTYYGRTTIGNRRFSNHKSRCKRGEHSCLQEVYDKYGCDDWVNNWLGWETGDLDYHNQIEFSRIQSDPKSLNILKGDYVLLNEEEQKKQRKKKTNEN